MATPASALVVKRANITITDGMVVYLPCDVQLFDFKNNRPESGKYLVEGSKVSLVLAPTLDAIAKGFKFYYVKQGNKEGYIPKSVFHDFVIAGLADSPRTGVTYGGDKWMKNGDGNLVAFPKDDEGRQPCDYCGCSTNDHKMYETYELTAMLDKLIGLLNESSAKGRFEHDRFMLAGLETESGAFMVAASGKLKASDIEEFKRCAGRLSQQPKVAVPLTGVKFLRGFDKWTTGTADLAAWSCAAPRVVQAAWRMNKMPFRMSEKWYGTQSGVHGQSIKSCDTCRATLPKMLCGLALWRHR